MEVGGRLESINITDVFSNCAEADTQRSHHSGPQWDLTQCHIIFGSRAIFSRYSQELYSRYIPKPLYTRTLGLYINTGRAGNVCYLNSTVNITHSHLDAVTLCVWCVFPDTAVAGRCVGDFPSKIGGNRRSGYSKTGGVRIGEQRLISSSSSCRSFDTSEACSVAITWSNESSKHLELKRLLPVWLMYCI